MTLASTSWKEATDTTSGDSTKYGVPDGLLLYAQLFNGDLNIDNVDINSPWFFRTSKCQFQNTANTYGYIIDSSAAIVADRTVSFPLLTADDSFVTEDMIQTISSKKVGNWLDSVESAAPSSPAASEHRFYVDSTSNQFTTKNNAGNVQEFITDSATQTLTNKTLTTPTINVLDNALFIKDNADNTKIAVFECSGITTATTRTYTLPDATGTLPLISLAQTWSAVQTFSSAPVFQDAVKVAFGTGSDSTIVDTGSGMLIDIDEQNAGSKSLVIESDATALFTINDTKLLAGLELDMGGNNIINGGTVFLTEQADADADVAGKGQLWVNTATPNEMYFTDDAGTDFQLASKTGTHAATQAIGIAVGDETTVLTTGTGKVEFQMPYAFTLTDVKATVTTAPTTDAGFTVDINEDGSTILSTKITLDATEKTSATATTPPVISDSSLAADGVITVDIDALSSGGTEAGLKIWLIGYQT